MKKWTMAGKITGGECTLFVMAETREEAIKKFKDNDWEAEEGSWEAGV